MTNTSATTALISTDTLAAWLGIDKTTHYDHDKTPGQLAREQVENTSTQDTGDDAGFVPVEPVPVDGRLVVLDVRWSATDPGEGHDAYRQGHIPGAVFVSMTGQLAGHGAPSAGRHPLPDPSGFIDSVRMLGIHNGDTVVVYDNVRGLSAARAWWLLRHAGFDKVYLLDGGLGSWHEAELPQQAGEVLPIPGDAHLSWGKMPVLTTEDIPDFVAEGVLLDARAHQRYTGESEPLDPIAGHIPGAHNLPGTDILDEHGHFLRPEELRAKFAEYGIDEHSTVAAYCGSGVTASHLVLGLYLAGFDAALYPGSFSAWVNTPDTQVATGEEPGSFN